MGSSNRYGLPLTSAVLEVADQLLLLRVDGDHRDAALDASFRLGINVLELSVAIRMLRALDCLVGRLQTVAVLTQQLGYRLVADPNTATLKEFYRQRVRPLASPAKGRLWVTTCDRIDQLLEIWPNFGVRLLEWPFSCAAPNVYDVLALCAGACLVAPLPDSADRGFVARATVATPPYPIASASALFCDVAVCFVHRFLVGLALGGTLFLHLSSSPRLFGSAFGDNRSVLISFSGIGFRRDRLGLLVRVLDDAGEWSIARF